MWWLMKWWSDMTLSLFFCLNSHIMGITDSATCKYFDMSTHMLKSKSWETCRVHFSCINTFYPPAAYSPLNRSTVSNQFKSLLFDALHLRIHLNRALVSMACKFNSNINKFLTNYYLFTSINTNSIKHTWQLWLLINHIGAKCCGGRLCDYCYQGYWHDWCKSFALPMIVACDYWQIVLSSADPFEMDFGDILLQPLSDSPAGSIDQEATSSDVKDDFNILRLKSPSPLAGSTPDWDELQLNMSPDEVLIQYQCMLTSLIGGKVNAPRTPPESHTDTWSTSQQDSSARSAAYKGTWAASYQAALSPTHQHIQPSLSTYAFHRSIVLKPQKPEALPTQPLLTSLPLPLPLPPPHQLESTSRSSPTHQKTMAHPANLDDGKWMTIVYQATHW